VNDGLSKGDEVVVLHMQSLANSYDDLEVMNTSTTQCGTHHVLHFLYIFSLPFLGRFIHKQRRTGRSLGEHYDRARYLALRTLAHTVLAYAVTACTAKFAT
jgi:hypothetical protein